MALKHAQPGEVVHLTAMDASAAVSKSTAIVKRDRFEAARLVVPAGSTIPTHQVAGYFTLQCLKGRVVIDAGREIELGAGDWVYLDRNDPHAVRGIEDSVLLLTILFDEKLGG
jgi:quercetin dioxygenase-like cupin family protein